MQSSLVIALCALLWGISTFLNRIVAKTTSPFFMQVVVGIIYFLYIPIALKMVGFNNLKNNLNNIWLVVVATVISISANVLLYAGLKNNSSSSNIMLISLYPAVSVILSAIFLNENLSLIKIIGIIVMVIGAIMLNIK